MTFSEGAIVELCCDWRAIERELFGGARGWMKSRRRESRFGTGGITEDKQSTILYGTVRDNW
jgi:hypothetical protein